MYHRNRVGRQPEGAGTNLEAQFGILALQAMQAKNLEPEKFPELVATVNRMARDIHCGQVITLEDAQNIIDLASPIAFIACDCRRQLHGYIERSRSM
jgi:RNA processing factor Prp31